MDGQSERMIQMPEQYLHVFINKDYNDWDKLLDQAKFMYNSNKSISTNLSPFKVLYGFQLMTPVSSALSSSNSQSNKNVNAFLRNHSLRFEVIQGALLDTQRRMANQYDHSRKDITFKVGDLVYLDVSDMKKPPGLAHKLLLCFCGPFKILEHPLHLNYHLDLPP